MSSQEYLNKQWAAEIQLPRNILWNVSSKSSQMSFISELWACFFKHVLSFTKKWTLKTLLYHSLIGWLYLQTGKMVEFRGKSSCLMWCLNKSPLLFRYACEILKKEILEWNSLVCTYSCRCKHYLYNSVDLGLYFNLFPQLFKSWIVLSTG